MQPVIYQVECAFGEEEFGGGFPTQGFSGSGVEVEGDGAELLLGEDAEIEAFGRYCRRRPLGAMRGLACKRWAAGA